MASLVIAALIVASTLGLLRDAANLALDGVPFHIARREVEAWLQGLPGVVEVHDLHIWALSTTDAVLTAHLVRADQPHEQELIRVVGHELNDRFGIGHATLQLETPTMAQHCRLRPADVV